VTSGFLAISHVFLEQWSWRGFFVCGEDLAE